MNIFVNQLNAAGEPLPKGLRKRLTAAARLLLNEFHFQNGEVAIILAGDSFLQQLNSQYRGLDSPTDVLTFSMLEPADWEKAAAGENEGNEGVIVGDIYISLDRAREQALTAGHSFERELLILAIHGLLHLFGYDHESTAAAEAMERREVDILNRVGRISG